MSGIYPLKGVVKNYDWGGTERIPSLLQIDNPQAIPFAEYWMGTHHSGMAQLATENGDKELITVSGKLPYLFKLLDVKKMLSIQVHPTKAAAAAEFAKENAANVPINAPTRNYKDNNHKPELMVALNDCWLLHGFKPQEELIDTLLNIEELRCLLPVFKKDGYHGLYHYVMEMPQAEVNAILQPLVSHLTKLYKDDLPEKNNPDFWTLKAVQEFSLSENIDRGIFSIYFFNLFCLKKGEAIFQAAGLPHAYLEGWNVEIMANSDNVLRGGLTAKHIDVSQLLKHIKCEATYPAILTGEHISESEMVYPVPVADFKLSRMQLTKKMKAEINTKGYEILLLTEGNAIIGNGTTSIELAIGKPVALVMPAQTIRIATTANTIIFRAFY